jgi:hypothetical protein
MKKALPFKKKELKKPMQPKKEYKEVIKPKKEVVSDPDKTMSICLTREQIFKIKKKMQDEKLSEYFERVLA